MSFEDNRVAVKEALNNAGIAYLHEAAGELTSMTQRNVPNRGQWFNQQKNAWRYEVDETKMEAVVGNPQERALWTEFGTGEYSTSEKGGRKGWWVYVKDGSDDGDSYSYKGGKSYTFEEAKRIVAMMRADGLDAHMTKGQQAHRPLGKAKESLQPKLEKLARDKYGGELK